MSTFIAVSRMRIHLFDWARAAKREAAAREIQKIYRGHDARSKTKRYVTQREWASMVIGRTCRHFLFRRNMGDARRLRRRIMAIRDADRAIREHERMEWEELTSLIVEALSGLPAMSALARRFAPSILR